ncbi:hypothetical protein [Flavobacterium limnosediminis]|nr:hypothetical protein [Flavobacterium limnosediminis]
MKKLAILTATLMIFSSCKEHVDKSNLSHHEQHPGCKHEEELGKVRDTFNLKLISLYNSNLPVAKLISKSDSLIKDFKESNSDLHTDIAFLCEAQINYFNAEMLYKNGYYQKSINELHKSNPFGNSTGDIAAGIAANYIKLEEFDKAKIFVDSIGKGYYLYEYALANYYETIKAKNEAVKIYKNIIDRKSHQERFYYKSSALRLEELERENPTFLHEIIFPTRKPRDETFKK